MSAAPLWTIIDAQRQELFAAKFDARRSRMMSTTVARRRSFARCLARADLQPGDRVIGPALRELQSQLPAGVIAVADEVCWQPTAAAVGQVGWQAYQRGPARRRLETCAAVLSPKRRRRES